MLDALSLSFYVCAFVYVCGGANYRFSIFCFISLMLKLWLFHVDLLLHAAHTQTHFTFAFDFISNKKGRRNDGVCITTDEISEDRGQPVDVDKAAKKGNDENMIHIYSTDTHTHIYSTSIDTKWIKKRRELSEKLKLQSTVHKRKWIEKRKTNDKHRHWRIFVFIISLLLCS